MANKPMAIMFNVASETYNAERAIDTLRQFAAGGMVWNYVPGLYLINSGFRADRLGDEIRKAGFGSFITFVMNPVEMDGDLPEEAWSAWFQKVFRNYSAEIIEFHGFPSEDMNLYLDPPEDD